MASSFGAELFKLRKRPATWVIGIIFAAATLLFGYLLLYLVTVAVSGGGQGAPQQGLPPFLLPESFLTNVLGTFANFGTALALILGALAMGSEYGWDTFKVSLTQRPGRLGFLGGKLLAVGALLLVITLAILLLGAAASYVIALAEDATVEWPSVLDILEGIGAGWLILATFAAMGVGLAALFRGTALAIGIGLVYVLVLESLFISLASQNETISNIGKRLPAKNALDLSGSFGQTPQALSGGAQGNTVEPGTAVLTLGIYAVAFLALAVLLFRSRDVT
ncbi:ABC transporter permease subunit [Rubrobacter aplysinae]|uniref:ABC transporter permease subunit n=1 Tax=Rubrobacter aplysinae TaxID=909625 RepID=UPI00064BBA7E|nr:ABC transporter permease subunit [Rubrobacter aplysinae]